jgi:hypothetical protein
MGDHPLDVEIEDDLVLPGAGMPLVASSWT